jgi:hypothetical protein
VCLLFGGVVAGVVWALSTQARWVQENKPLIIQKPVEAEADAPAPPPPNATGVVGSVSEDTREAMARDLEARRRDRKGKGRKAGP